MSKTEDKWGQPHQVSDLMVAFPAQVLGTLLPRHTEVPEDFAGSERGRAWREFVDTWFCLGLNPETLALLPAEGVNPERAWRHLTAVLSSFEPKHEHKILGVAWLASRWFSAVRYGGPGKGPESVRYIGSEAVPVEEWIAALAAQERGDGDEEESDG